MSTFAEVEETAFVKEGVEDDGEGIARREEGFAASAMGGVFTSRRFGAEVCTRSLSKSARTRARGRTGSMGFVGGGFGFDKDGGHSEEELDAEDEEKESLASSEDVY